MAAAIQQRWGGELYCLSRTGLDAQHVVVRFGEVFIDHDGPASAVHLIRKFKRGEVITARSLRLVPFTTNMSGDIPGPRNQKEIVVGICNQLA